jgi:hypothetical protein
MSRHIHVCLVHGDDGDYLVARSTAHSCGGAPQQAACRASQRSALAPVRAVQGGAPSPENETNNTFPFGAARPLPRMKPTTLFHLGPRPRVTNVVRSGVMRRQRNSRTGRPSGPCQRGHGNQCPQAFASVIYQPMSPPMTTSPPSTAPDEMSGLIKSGTTNRGKGEEVE